MDELDSLRLELLSGDQRELAECIGLPAYISLVRRYGGCNIYIGKGDKAVAAARDERIRNEYTGGNIPYLSRKYGLAENTIRGIVSPLRTLPGQMDLFGGDNPDTEKKE